MTTSLQWNDPIHSSFSCNLSSTLIIAPYQCRISVVYHTDPVIQCWAYEEGGLSDKRSWINITSMHDTNLVLITQLTICLHIVHTSKESPRCVSTYLTVTEWQWHTLCLPSIRTNRLCGRAVTERHVGVTGCDGNTNVRLLRLFQRRLCANKSDR